MLALGSRTSSSTLARSDSCSSASVLRYCGNVPPSGCVGLDGALLTLLE